MSLVAVPPFALWDVGSGKGAVFTSLTLDAANEKHAVIVQAPKAGVIDRFSFRTGVVTTGETVDGRVETLAADGTPSGSLWAANTNGAVVINNADDNVWKEVILTSGATVAKGDLLALVVAMPGVTSGNLTVVRTNQTTAQSLPYPLLFTTGWVRNGAGVVGSVRYNDGVYPPIVGLMPYLTISSLTFNSDSTPDERGNTITVPFACKVSGVWRSGTTQDGDYTLKVYDDADVVLSDLSFDGNVHADDSDLLPEYLMLDNELTLAAGDIVRVTVTATTATTASLPDVTAPPGMGSALPGGGQMVHTSRTDGGAWTDTTDRMSMIGLIISALDDGAGGGGGTTQGNLGSALRGVAR